MFDSPLKDGVIVLAILLLFFGPKRLPALSRAIGESVREFRGGIHSGDSEHKSEIAGTAPVSAAPEAPAAAAAPAPAAEPAPTGTSEQPTNA